MGIDIIHGDCLAEMPKLTANSVDAIITDPPYGLKFMGRAWDHGVPGVPFWTAALRVLKPGGHMLCFGGTRTAHRLVCAIEDAGFDIRDSVLWLYGSGFPKSHDVSKAIDKAAGAVREKVAPRSVIAHQRNIGNRRPYMDNPNHMTDSDVPATPEAAQWEGWGTALKPAFEPIILARKPLDGTVAANVLAHGVGGINIDACRVSGVVQSAAGSTGFGEGREDGYEAGTGREYSAAGRFPANVLHDGSPEVLAAFAAFGSISTTGQRSADSRNAIVSGTNWLTNNHRSREYPNEGGGSAARFFYSAKADADDRLKSKHPTVKPVDLMRWLARLITPPGGIILDPFAGSGTTGMAAMAEGFSAILIEREADYIEDIRYRVAHVSGLDTPLFA